MKNSGLKSCYMERGSKTPSLSSQMNNKSKCWWHIYNIEALYCMPECTRDASKYKPDETQKYYDVISHKNDLQNCYVLVIFKSFVCKIYSSLCMTLCMLSEDFGL